MDFEPNGDMIVFDADTLPPPPRDDCEAEVNDIRESVLLGNLSNRQCEMRSIDASCRSSTVVSQASPSPSTTSIHYEHRKESRQSCGAMVVEHHHNPDICSARARDDAVYHEADGSGGWLRDASGPPRHLVGSTASAWSQSPGCTTGPELDSPGGGHFYQVEALHARSTQPCMLTASVASGESVYAERFYGGTHLNEHTAEVRPGQNDSSRKERRCDLTSSQFAWTEDLNELFFRVRDVAQLHWRTPVTYFPGTTPHCVRQRYQQL